MDQNNNMGLNSTQPVNSNPNIIPNNLSANNVQNTNMASNSIVQTTPVNNQIEASVQSPSVNVSSTQDQNQNNVDSITVDYDNLYKLETDTEKKPQAPQQQMTADDIQFEMEDSVEDQTIINKQEKAETKRNLIFMIVIAVILIAAITFGFPKLFDWLYHNK